MRQKLIFALGLMVVAWAVLSAVPAWAAGTVAAGPYYAMPSWDQTLPSSTRFIVLTNMSSQAVLDRETGLVWEQSPSTIHLSWEYAQLRCNNLNTGGRMGWRLPTLQELLSLIDQTQSSPALPAGHPFTVQTYDYWSATSQSATSGAWYVYLGDGGVDFFDKSSTFNAWCVRGGQGVNPQ